MSVLSVQSPYPIFTDTDGDPLESGYIWIGVANLDPQVNPLAVYWDAALTMPAVQPIRTLAGYPSQAGSTGRIYTNADHSIRVQNKRGSMVFTAASVWDRISADSIVYIGPDGLSYTVQDLSNKTNALKGSALIGHVGPDNAAYNLHDISVSSDVAKGDALISVKQPITGAVARTQHDKNTDNITVIDVGASNVPGVITPANNTLYMQTMLDNYDYVKFVPGTYEITELFFRRTDQKIYAYGAIFKGMATVATSAIIHLVNPNVTIHGLTINGNYNVNYPCALKWHDLLAGDSIYPGRCKIYGLDIANALIGIMYGDSVAPVDAPVSENFITGFSTRAVIRPIYTNQPNGFLHIVNGLFDCQKYEWDINSPGAYNDNVACCIENKQCELLISNSEFIKAASAVGFGIVNFGKLLINNCSSEIIATNFYTDFGGVTIVNGYTNNFFNNGSSAFISMGSNISSSGRTNIFDGNLIYLNKNPAVVGAAEAVVATGSSTDSRVTISDSLIQNQNLGSILKSDFGFWSASDVRFHNTRIDNGTTFLQLDNNSKNIASAYTTLDIANFTVTAGVGTSAIIAAAAPAHPKFVNALKITGAAGVSCLVQTKIELPVNSGNSVILELTMQGSAVAPETFFGSLIALYVDDAAGFLGISTLDNGAGGVAHLSAISGAQGWKTVRYILNIPARSAYFLLRFGVDSEAQVFWIGDIKVL